MKSSYRLGLVAVLVLAAAAGGLFFFLRPRASSSATDAQLLTYLPPANDTYVFADVAALRRGGVLQLLDAVPVAEEAEYKTFVSQTGFRYQDDLDRALLLVQPARTLAVLDGRFDWSKLKKFAQGQGGRCDGELCHLASSQPGRVISFRKLGGNLLALASASDADAVRLIGPNAHGIAPAEIPTRPVWISFQPSMLHAEDSLPAGTKLFARVLANTDRVVFSVGPEQNRYAVGMDVRCRSEHDAQIITEELQKITKVLQDLISREKQTPNPNDLSGVLTAGTFRRQDSEVIGHWPVEPAFFKNLSGSPR